MTSKRAVLAKVVHRLRLDALVRRVGRSYGENTLTVVNYHRVNEPDAARRFDEGTLDATIRGFSEQIALVKREYSLLTPAEFRQHLTEGSWPRRPALITFDDGYRDNHDWAKSLLEQQGIRALFFVATDYITKRRVFWWDRISYLLKHAKNSQFTLGYPQPQVIDIRSGTLPEERRLHRFIKRTVGLDVERFLVELADAAGVDWTNHLERQLADELLMTWQQIRGLCASGMGIGSHTRTHRVLDTMSPDELDSELCGSRQDIEAEIGQEVWAVAYPVGYRVAHVPTIRAAIERARYEVGFVYNGCVQPLTSLDVLDVGRLAVERDWELSRFSAALSFAACR